MSGTRTPLHRRVPPAVLAGVSVLAVVSVLYPVVAAPAQRPLAVFLLPAGVVALFGSWRSTVLVGVAALGVAAAEGVVVGGLTAAGLGARLGTMTLALVVATLVTAQREKRDRALRATVPQLSAALRTTRALHAGVVGTWHWNRRTGAVEWDAELHELFGLTPGTFEGTFDAWMSRVHPDDRHRIVEAVAEGVEERRVFSFDQRCTWPNGEVHWLQAVGEVVFDHDHDHSHNPGDHDLTSGSGTSDRDGVLGASGVALNIDDRIARLEHERRQRDRLQFLARTNRALVESLDVSEVVDTVAAAAVPELADWCAIVVTIDRPAEAPLLRVATDDPVSAAAARRTAMTTPWRPTPDGGLGFVVRTGRVEFEPELTADRAACVVPLAVVEASAEPATSPAPDASPSIRSSIVVPLRGTLGVLGAVQFLRASNRPAFTPADVELVADLADTIGSALTNAVLSRRQEVAHAALASLQRLTATLVAATTTAEVAASVVGTGTAALHAAWGSLHLLDDDGELHRVPTTSIHRGRADAERATDHDPQPDGRHDVAAQAAAAAAVRARAPVWWTGCDSAGPDPTPTGQPVSLGAVPLRFGPRILGALVVAWDPPRELDATSLELLFQIAGRCSGALERARLFERQCSVATTLQRSLLPSRLVAPAWLEVDASYQAAELGTEVGGDFYDVVPLGPRGCLLVIGDVCGKGVEAATLTAVARHTARATVAFTSRPEDVLRAVHKAVLDTGRASYITVAAVRLHRTPGGAVAEVALGGHPEPRVRRADGAVERLGAPGTLLGMIEPVLCTRRHRLGTGDTVLLFTDGVTDAPGTAGIGPDELDDLLRSAPGAPTDLIASVVAAVGGCRRGEASDDIALLAARVR